MNDAPQRAVIAGDALDVLFRKARTYNTFVPGSVSENQLRALYDLMKCGPTSANCQPQRILFLIGAEAKERLRPALSASNATKTIAAPVTALLAYDLRFYEHLPRMFHNPQARSWFEGKPAVIETTGFRNATLQGAYFMLAARAVGLDCGPMSGFDNAKVDAAFFPDGRCKSNFLCNLGRGDPATLAPATPRLSFDEVCSIL